MKASFLQLYFSFSCCMAFQGGAIAQTQYTISEPYDFPTKPGTQRWASLPDISAQVAACEIPGAVARAMTTEALVESCMTHPLKPLVAAYNEIGRGVDFLYNNFYGFKELVKRRDAAKCLVQYYGKMQDKLKVPSGYDVVDCMFVHSLLMKNEIASLFSDDQRRTLAEMCLKGVLELRRVHGRTGGEGVAALFAIKLITENGVTLTKGSRHFGLSDLPRNSHKFLLGEPVEKDFLDQVHQFASTVVSND